MEFKIINCKPEHFDFVRKLRNVNKIRRQMIHKELNYLNKDYMKRYYKCFKICMFNDILIGYMRVIDDDVGIIVKPKYQKKGAGSFMLNNLFLFKKDILKAKIRINNLSSLKLFKKNNFIEEYIILKKEFSKQEVDAKGEVDE